MSLSRFFEYGAVPGFLYSGVFEQFEFIKPEKDFELLSDGTGYQSLDKKAMIKIIVVPGDYISSKEEFRKIKNTKGTLILDSCDKFNKYS